MPLPSVVAEWKASIYLLFSSYLSSVTVYKTRQLSSSSFLMPKTSFKRFQRTFMKCKAIKEKLLLGLVTFRHFCISEHTVFVLFLLCSIKFPDTLPSGGKQFAFLLAFFQSQNGFGSFFIDFLPGYGSRTLLSAPKLRQDSHDMPRDQNWL